MPKMDKSIKNSIIALFSALVIAGLAWWQYLRLSRLPEVPYFPGEFFPILTTQSYTLLLAIPAAVIIALVSLLGYELGGSKLQLGTAMVALISTPLLFNALADGQQAFQLLLWTGLLLVCVRFRAGYNRLLIMTGGILTGFILAGNVVMVFMVVPVVFSCPRAGRKLFLLLLVTITLLLWQLPVLPDAPFRSDVHGLCVGLNSEAGQLTREGEDWFFQARRLGQVYPEAVTGYLLRQSFTRMMAEPGGILKRWWNHVLAFARPVAFTDDYPWSMVRSSGGPFKYFLGWGIIVPLAILGWFGIDKNQRRALGGFILAPCVASIILVPHFWYRGLLMVPLAYLAARGVAAVTDGEFSGRVVLGLGVVIVAWTLLPFLSPAPVAPYWRELTVIEMRSGNWEAASSMVSNWTAAAPRDPQAWQTAGYLAGVRGERWEMQRLLIRSAVWAPDENTRLHNWSVMEELIDRFEAAQLPKLTES